MLSFMLVKAILTLIADSTVVGFSLMSKNVPVLPEPVQVSLVRLLMWKRNIGKGMFFPNRTRNCIASRIHHSPPSIDLFCGNQKCLEYLIDGYIQRRKQI